MTHGGKRKGAGRKKSAPTVIRRFAYNKESSEKLDSIYTTKEVNKKIKNFLDNLIMDTGKRADNIYKALQDKISDKFESFFKNEGIYPKQVLINKNGTVLGGFLENLKVENINFTDEDLEVIADLQYFQSNFFDNDFKIMKL